VFLPLSVMMVAEALGQAGFEVQIIDMRTRQDWRRELLAAVRRRPLFVGVSAMTGRQIHFGLNAARVVRKADPALPLVWGGIHASVLPEETLRDDYVDAVVAGDGEGAAVKIASALAVSDRDAVLGRVFTASPESVPGSMGVTGIDLSKVDFEPYITPVVHHIRGLAHVTSHGCPHHCGYCYNRAVRGAGWRADPPEAVVAHLEQLSALGIRGVIFYDDNFFVSRKRVERIARGIIDKGISMAIKADCRADYLVRYEADFLSLIRRAGFKLLYIGAESGSDRMLDVMQKGVTVETTLRANVRLRDAAIRPHYSFMCGLPGETMDDMRATLKLMQRLKTDHPGAYLSPVKAYVPYPGTALFEVARQAGFEAPASLASWSAFDWNPTPSPWLSRKESRFVQKMVYATAALDPSVVELAGIRQGKFATWGFHKFADLCRARCQKTDLGLIPELPLVRAARRIVAHVR
jgi:anaerobic magnesium-protoporphyrin IX monomethyl ester cyclase